MFFQPRAVYLADSFMLPVGKYNGRHRPKMSFFELVDALQPLLNNSKIDKDRIGCVVVGSQNPFAFSGIDNVAAKVSGRLGISGAKSVLVDTASSSGASAFEAAFMEVASGQHDHVLALGIQKMSDVSTREATKIVAGVIDREEAEYGLTMPACGSAGCPVPDSEIRVESGKMEPLYLALDRAVPSLCSAKSQRTSQL